MLRKGKYRPAGRGKPSSEYLFAAAMQGSFPAINFFVDAANLISLVSGYPISLIDGEKAGPNLHLRLGRPGERYIFNEGDQSIDVEDLLCICRNDGAACVPTANPVRDSMATKLFAPARSAIAVIYAPKGPEGRDLETACDHLAAFLSERAETVHWAVVVPRNSSARQIPAQN
jgi:DNA/RNA-binding domain of Phe-tRNA-synthetase-like protein